MITSKKIFNFEMFALIFSVVALNFWRLLDKNDPSIIILYHRGVAINYIDFLTPSLLLVLYIYKKERTLGWYKVKCLTINFLFILFGNLGDELARTATKDNVWEWVAGIGAIALIPVEVYQWKKKNKVL